MSSTHRVGQRFAQLIEVPAVIITFLMMFHITLNAVLRTFWDRPIDNTLEIVQFIYMPIVALLGFVAAQLRGQHIGADLVFEKLPAVTRRFVGAGVSIVSALLCAGIAWFGWGYATHAREIRQTAGLTDIASWPVYYLIPVVFAVLAVLYVVEAMRRLAEQDVSAQDRSSTPDERVTSESPANEEARA
jgi:TRAP-type C4-dicarboxylate transport system permease small subunit